jgi:hypothetical protein
LGEADADGRGGGGEGGDGGLAGGVGVDFAAEAGIVPEVDAGLVFDVEGEAEVLAQARI